MKPDKEFPVHLTVLEAQTMCDARGEVVGEAEEKAFENAQAKISRALEREIDREIERTRRHLISQGLSR